MNENFKMENLEEDQLYHHGILGMKWGVRRTPEQLGHRTGSGEKRKGSTGSGKKGLLGRRKKSGGSDEAAAKPKKKSISEMSDDELRAYQNRLQMTKNTMDLERQIASMQPKAMKQQIMEKLVKEVLPSAAKKLGDKYVDQILKKAFPEAEDPVAKLKKEYDLKKTEYDIYNLDFMRAKSKYNKAKAEYDFKNLGKDDKSNSEKDDKSNSEKETGSNTTSTERKRRGAIGIRGMRWGVRQSGSDESDSSSSTSRGFGEAFANSMRDYTMSQAATSSATSAGMDAVNQMLSTSLRRLPIPESEEDD